MSKHIADLKIGDTLAFKGPIQKFPYKANEFDHGVCVSGGSGITPMYQLITHAMDLKDDKTKFTLIFSNVTDKDILLRKEWDELVKANPDRLKVVYALDKAPYFWKGECHDAIHSLQLERKRKKPPTGQLTDVSQ
jgi:NAD(P)H-flavin reductase